MDDDPALLEIKVTSGDDWICLAPIGELDAASCDLLSHTAKAALAVDSHELRLDLQGITFIDSAGLHCLMLQSRQGTRLVNPSHAVVRICEITGLYKLLLG